MNGRRRYSIFVCFIHGLEEKNSKSEVIFAVCRPPLASCLTSLICICLLPQILVCSTCFLSLYKTESYKWSMSQNYTQSGTLWIYGDSLGRILYESIKPRSLCKLLYKKCSNSVMHTYDAHNKGLNIALERDLDFRPEKVIETIVNVLHRPEMQQKESVFLLNLNLHFVGKINFTTYQKLIDDLILTFKTKELSPGERVLKYKAKIIWKSSTAICKEMATSTLNRTDARFFTTQVCTF